MTFIEFEALIELAIAELPKKFRNILVKNEITIIPRQRTPAALKKKGTIIFGVFVGVQLGRFVDMQTEPTRIELYKESFEEVYKDPDEIKRQINVTVIHEIAHYFGFSEKEIRKLGY